jgi:outer membrane protein assembly factor BamB
LPKRSPKGDAISLPHRSTAPSPFRGEGWGEGLLNCIVPAKSLSVWLILLFLSSLVLAAEPTSNAVAIRSLLAPLAVYADTGTLAKAQAVLSNAVVKGKADAQSVVDLSACYKSHRLYDEGIAALRFMDAFCADNARGIRPWEEGRLRVLSGDFIGGLKLLEPRLTACGDTPSKDSDQLGVEVFRAGQLNHLLNDALIQEVSGLRENLAFAQRNADKGAAMAVKLIQSQGDQIFLLDTGSGLSAPDFIRKEIGGWPKELQDSFAGALETAAEKALGVLPEGDVRAFGEFWRCYRGTKAAARGALALADNLLDLGRPELAFQWYGALRQVVRGPRLDAKYAVAMARMAEPMSLTAFVETLSAEARSGMVEVGGRTLTLGEFIAGLPVKPPVSTVPPTSSEGLKLTPAWVVPVAPSNSLLFNASQFTTTRDRIDPVVVAPVAYGPDVFINTGVFAYRRDAATGSNLWTTAIQGKVVTDLSGHKDYPKWLPKFPLPVFGAQVRDGVVVCPYAEQVTSIRALEIMGVTALDLATGSIRWRTRDIPGVAGLHAASEPCIAGGIVCFLVQEGELSRAVGVEARTGTLLWNRLLVGVSDDPYGEAPPTALANPPTATLAHGGQVPRPLPAGRGVCFIPHKGWVFLLDPLTGSVEWMRRYTRTPLDGIRPSLCRPNPLLAAGGTIVVAPFDSTRIFALDAATGKTLWDKPAALEPYLCGVWQNRIVTFGRGLRLLDAGSGATVAAAPMNWAPSLAVGVVAGDRAWITDAQQTRLFDLRSLKEVDAIAYGGRLLPAAGLAISYVSNSVSAFRLGGAGPSAAGRK